MSLAGYIKLTFGNVSVVDEDANQNSSADCRTAERKTSRFHGVSWDVDVGKWKAELRNDGQITALGHNSNEEVAAWLYDAAALRVHGSSDQLNFPAVSGCYLKYAASRLQRVSDISRKDLVWEL
jgi:hypothetical protein